MALTKRNYRVQPDGGIVFADEPEADSPGYKPGGIDEKGSFIGGRNGGRYPDPGLNALKPWTRDARIWAAGVCEFFGSWHLYRNRPLLVIETTGYKDTNPALTRLTTYGGGSVSLSQKGWIVKGAREALMFRKRYKLTGVRVYSFYNAIEQWLSPERREQIKNRILYRDEHALIPFRKAEDDNVLATEPQPPIPTSIANYKRQTEELD